MGLSACQVPYEPSIHGAEKQLAACGFFLCALDVIEYPLDFCGGKIRVDEQTCFVAEKLFKTLLGELCADVGSSSALPHDSVIDWLACVFIPDYRGLTLVGHADSGDFLGGDARLFYGFLRDFKLAVPDVHRVVLDPAAFDEYLRELFLTAGEFFAVFVENKCA